MSRRTTAGRRYLVYPVIAGLAVLIAWELYVDIAKVSPIFLPAPTAIVAALAASVDEGILLPAIAVTLVRIVAGFALAAVAGVVVGLLMGMSRTAEAVADGFIAALYPLPKISLIPLLIIWLGTGEANKLAISAISAFFPIVINTFLGVRQVDEGLVRAAKNLGASTLQVQWKVILPSALPSILAGFRLAMGVSFILIVAAEMIASSSGLGYLLFRYGQILETEKVFGLLLVLAVLGWCMTKLQAWLDRVIAPWAAPARSE